MKCPLCGTDGGRVLLRDGERTVLRCRACTLGYLSPFPSAEELSAMYGHSYYFRDERYESNLRGLVTGPLRKRVPGGRVLDVGAGGGLFLRLAREAGFDAEGIDTSAASVELCQKEGLRVRQASLTDLAGADGSYDMITLWDVIEHLEHPLEHVIAARRLLRPGGWLVMKTPHIDWSMLAMSRLMKPFASPRVVLGYPGHVVYFNRASMELVLTKAGFKVDEIQRVGALREKSRKSLSVYAYHTALAGLNRARLGGNLLSFAKKD